MKTYTQEQLASRIANLRSVENVMSKYAFLTYYKRFDEALQKIYRLCQCIQFPGGMR